MIVVRGIFRAKYGRGDELVQLMKESREIWPDRMAFDLMTDLSGPFFTVVTEARYESLSAWENDFKTAFGDERVGAWFERMMQLVETGSREFYTLVET